MPYSQAIYALPALMLEQLTCKVKRLQVFVL